jgi:hypothetical protein
MSLDASSQSDTINVSRSDLIRKLIQVERLKADSAEMVRKTAEVADLNRLTQGQAITIGGLQKTTEMLEKVNIVLVDENKKLKKQNKLTLLIAGVLISLFIIKK